MGEIQTIHIASDFSAYPIGRDDDDSPDTNGRKFREDFLVPGLEAARASGGTLIVDFEGVESFGSSFLEEAFGGLVRKSGWTASELKKHLRIVHEWSGYARAERQAWDYIETSKPDN